MDVESPIDYVEFDKNQIIDIASQVSSCLEDHNAGIFGGVATASYIGESRQPKDIDILCPKTELKDLVEDLRNRLGQSEVEINPAGASLVYREGNQLLDIEVMAYESTPDGTKLPFDVYTDKPLSYKWMELEGKKVRVVSKNILIEMKSKSNRVKDKEDLAKLTTN